jgi:hypothetical protein
MANSKLGGSASGKNHKYNHLSLARNPSALESSGYCGPEASLLSQALPYASAKRSFRKQNKISVSKRKRSDCKTTMSDRLRRKNAHVPSLGQPPFIIKQSSNIGSIDTTSKVM